MNANSLYGVTGKCKDSGAPIVSYSRKLDKEGLQILVDNGKVNSWEHTGIYGTFHVEGICRCSVEINALWSNCVNVTRLVDGEKLEVDPKYIIPAGEPGTLLALAEQVARYEQNNQIKEK